MSLAVHIPFYNPNPKKKEGFRELTREEYLVENIINLKTLNIKKIFLYIRTMILLIIYQMM